LRNSEYAENSLDDTIKNIEKLFPVTNEFKEKFIKSYTEEIKYFYGDVSINENMSHNIRKSNWDYDFV
jgi:hypothetical protein